MSEDKKRVIVYVDGFNFYYGLKHKGWKKYYWLDLVAYMEKCLKPDQELVAIKYFSATPLDNRGKADRQDAWFSASKENPKFKLMLGKYLRKSITCYNCQNTINTYEEKESDVKLALEIVADAYEDKCDFAIIITADSDIAPAIYRLQERGKPYTIYFPPGHSSHLLNSLSHNGRAIQMERFESRFKACQLPEAVTLSNGYIVTRPDEWK